MSSATSGARGSHGRWRRRKACWLWCVHDCSCHASGHGRDCAWQGRWHCPQSIAPTGAVVDLLGHFKPQSLRQQLAVTLKVHEAGGKLLYASQQNRIQVIRDVESKELQLERQGGRGWDEVWSANAFSLPPSSPHLPPSAMGHLRFDDDDDMDAVPSTTAPAVPVLHAAASTIAPALLPHVCCSLRVDSNNSSPSYVFSVDVSPAHDACVASTSERLIKAYAMSPAALVHVADLTGHEATISDAAFSGTHTVHSCSRDGTVRGWDLRSRNEAERYAHACMHPGHGVCILAMAYAGDWRPKPRLRRHEWAWIACGSAHALLLRPQDMTWACRLQTPQQDRAPPCQ